MRRIAILSAILACAAIGPSISAAQSKEEYKRASEAAGCDLIPYSSLRQSCEYARHAKDAACSNRTFVCGDIDRSQKSEIDRRVEIGEQCLSKSEALAKIVEHAQSTLRSDKNKQFTAISADKIEAEQPGHRRQVEDVKRAVFECKQLAK